MTTHDLVLFEDYLAGFVSLSAVRWIIGSDCGKLGRFLREECRVNAMRSGTLKKKYLKRISKTFVVCKVTPIFPKNFGKK